MRLLAIPFLLALAALTAAPRAQHHLLPEEVEAFALKSAGRYEEALDAFLALSERELRDTDDAMARAEFATVMAVLMAERTGAVETRKHFAELAARPILDHHPVARDRLLHAAMRLDLAAGDLPTAIERQRDLGYLSRFWICGPFDNERGQGFARAYPPEEGLDLSTSFEGKKRPVTWRELPAIEPPGGVVDLGATVRPNQQVLVYAATALIADEDVDAMLLLGTDGSYRVFLNGQEAGARDVRRRRSPDQDAIGLRLRAGPNLLLLKICGQDGPLTVSARLRATDGAPLSRVVDSDGAEDLVAAARTSPAEPREVPLHRGALDVLQQLAAEGSAADAFRLGTLLALASPDDPNERRDRALAEQAVAGLPDFLPARYLLAFTRVQQGRAEEKDENARRRDYEAILAQDPQHAEALRSLAEMELQDVGAAERAERLCRAALEVCSDFATARLLLAAALEAQGLDPLAEQETLRAAEVRRSARAARAAFEVASRRGDLGLAETLARRALTTAATTADADRLARVLLRRGARDQALDVLRAAEATAPFASGPPRRIARVLEAGGDLDGASAALRSWLSVCPEDDGTLVDVARIAGLRGDGELERALLREALELNPNRKSEARLLEFLEVDQAPFYRAYEVDADAVIAEARTPPADAEEANDSHHWILQQEVVHAYRNGTRSIYRHRIARVLSDRAVRSFSTWVARRSSSDQRSRILSARVIKADGRELRPRLRGAFAQLPPLEVGDVIDVRTRIDDLAPTFFGDYFGLVHPFAARDGQPVALSELVLILDDGRDYRFQRSNGAPAPRLSTDADGHEVRRHAMRDLPRREAEERAPGWKETAPLVRVTTYADWNAFTSWWWNLIRRQSDVSPAMRTKVAELIDGKHSDLEKIAAIYSFVTNEVRYKAWEFGVHGYKPYSTSVIFERRHGDCKDKSLLLNALLGEAGIESWPVLIWAKPRRDTDDLSLAMVEHFNHCISYLPPLGDRPALFLDGTATWHATGDVPEMDQGARVLVVRGSKGEIRDVPYVAADANVDAREFTFDVSPDGSGQGTFLATPRSNSAVPFRGFLANQPARRAENVERMLSRQLGGVKVVALDAGEPADPTQPIRLEVTFESSDLGAVQGNGLALRPAFEVAALQRLTPATSRTQPLLLGVPEQERQELRYRLPPGWAPVELPPPVRLAAPFGSYELSWTFEGGVLTASRTRSLRVPRIEPQEYAEFREFASRVDAADRRTVLVRPEGR